MWHARAEPGSPSPKATSAANPRNFQPPDPTRWPHPCDALIMGLAILFFPGGRPKKPLGGRPSDSSGPIPIPWKQRPKPRSDPATSQLNSNRGVSDGEGRLVSDPPRLVKRNPSPTCLLADLVCANHNRELTARFLKFSSRPSRKGHHLWPVLEKADPSENSVLSRPPRKEYILEVPGGSPWDGPGDKAWKLRWSFLFVWRAR